MAATAYAALVSLFNNVELIQTHPLHSFSFDNKQIQSLLQIVCFLIDFMETGDYGCSKEEAEALERQIASATHAAEDVIESHVVDQIRAGSTLDGEKRSVTLPDVQKVIEDMEFVRREAMKVQKAQSGFKAEHPTFSSTPPTSLKDKMVGFDDKLFQLLDLLTGYPSSRRVIPIVGTGGIGKTTLAKNAFQNSIIVSHFHVCLWVTISQQYIVTDILLALLCRHGESNSKSVGEIGEELHKSLYGRRFLIVLDDMWSVKAWDEIRHFFPDTSCGSRIIVTSRQSDVASHFGSLSLVMTFLTEKESWDLFCQKAFAEQSCPLELEEAGKKIVERCGGLPLAIVVVGGHLGMSPRTQEYWENAANHLESILNSGENNDQVFDILYLSYSHLPVHLKPCFLSMGIFKEDAIILVSQLTPLWIAEGFLKPKEGKTLEEVGEDCLNDLIRRNLILDVVDHTPWEHEWGREGCFIHDVLREMCLKIAQKENFFCVFHTSRSIDSERRVVNNEGTAEEMQNVMRFAPLLRSRITGEERCVLFGSKLLRVVHADKWTDKQDCIFTRSVNLRYLRGDFQLNSSISLPWNLQTIILKVHGIDTIVAPCEIWKLTQLRHLKCCYVFLLDPLPSDMVLHNLQTLVDVANLRLSDEVCQRIPNIKDLELTYNHSLKDRDEPGSYCSHNLGQFQKLELLYCGISWNWQDQERREFSSAITFPSSLKKLSLYNVHLDWEEITMKIGSLPLLEVLQLEDVEGGVEWNPVEGGFPRLRELYIDNCSRLRNWNAERSHFPVLEHLCLQWVTLDELPCEIGEIPTLQHIYLTNFTDSLGISALRIVVEQEDNGNDNIQLHVRISCSSDRESFRKRVQEEGLPTKNLHMHEY